MSLRELLRGGFRGGGGSVSTVEPYVFPLKLTSQVETELKVKVKVIGVFLAGASLLSAYAVAPGAGWGGGREDDCVGRQPFAVCGAGDYHQTSVLEVSPVVSPRAV